MLSVPNVAAITPTDAIVLLRRTQEVRRLFTRSEKAGVDAHVATGEIVEEIIEALTVDTHLENEVLYPRVRVLLPDREDSVLESYVDRLDLVGPWRHRCLNRQGSGTDGCTAQQPNTRVPALIRPGGTR